MASKKEDLKIVLADLKAQMNNLSTAKAVLKRMFNIFDINADKQVSLAEMQLLVAFKVVEADKFNALLKFDRNHDRRISFGEFLEFVFEALVY